MCECSCPDHLKLRTVQSRVGKRLVLLEAIRGCSLTAGVNEGGEVGVTRDLLRLLTEGELVVVVCHELAHLREGHLPIIVEMATSLDEEYKARINAGELATKVRAELNQRYTELEHQHEFIADAEGAEMAIERCGVTALECLSALKRTCHPSGKMEEARPTILFAPGPGHPPLADRIDRLSVVLLKKGYLK